MFPGQGLLVLVQGSYLLELFESLLLLLNLFELLMTEQLVAEKTQRCLSFSNTHIVVV